MHHILKTLIIILFATNVFAADAETKPAPAFNDYVIAVIGETEVKFSDILKEADVLNRFLKENFQMSQQWRLNYIRENIARRALAVRAENQGLINDKDVKFSLDQAKRHILSEKLVQDYLGANVKIEEEDLKNYYQENIEKYQIKAKIKASYIELKSEKEGEKIVSQLNAGKSFDKLARKSKQTIENWISQDSPMVEGLQGLEAPEVMDKLFALGVGGSSGVIEIGQEESKYYIFHIEQKEAAQNRPFAEVRRQVEFEYQKKVVDKMVNDFILETFEQQKVTIYQDKIVEEMGKEKK